MNILKGVTPIKVTKSKQGRTNIKFRTPYSTKVVSSKNYRKLLKENSKSITQMILDINNMTVDDLPVCKICGKNHVRLIGNNSNNLKRIDLLYPIIDDCCSSESCIQSMRATRGNLTAIKNGNHPVQTGCIRRYKHYYYKNNKFLSLTELSIFKRYERFLSKYYISERKVSSYSIGDRTKSYIADYIKKPQYKKIDIPDIIEVKGGNLFKERGKPVMKINYLKFKSVINSEMTIMILDRCPTSKTITKHIVKTVDELNKIFNVTKPK